MVVEIMSSYGEKTKWPVPVLSLFDIDDTSNSNYQYYTKVMVEIPDALKLDLSSIGLAVYWLVNPQMRTKNTSSTFKTVVDFISDSLVLHCSDGNKYTNSSSHVTIIDDNIFTFDIKLVSFFVEYLPSDINLLKGNNTSYFTSLNIESALVTPGIDYKLLLKIRETINRIESFIGIVPTNWIGGNINKTRGDYTNLIPGITPINYIHIKDIHDKLSNIINYMYAADILTIISISDITSDDVINISYIQEILDTIELIETQLISG
jgi:hypothetical protein